MAKFSDEIVRAAVGGRKAVRVYDLPGSPGVKVGIRFISDSDQDGCRLRAQEIVVKRKCQIVIDPEFFDLMIQREILALAYVDADAHEDAFFSSAEEVSQLDPRLRGACWDLYQNHQVEMDPARHLSPEEVTELVELIKKSPRPEELSSLFDPTTQWSFVISLANAVHERSPTPKSATG